MCESLEQFSGVHSSTSDQHKDLRPTTKGCDGVHFSKFLTYIQQHSPFCYKGECSHKLVSIATGVVAPESANPDCVIEIGEAAADRLTGLNYADAKLRRNDKVTSIGSANNSTEVRGHDVEIDLIFLLIRVTCVMRNTAEMKENLTHKFSKHPPSLFEGSGFMRKNAKSALANALKAHVEPLCATDFQNPLYFIDGGDMLHTMVWPKDSTYQDVINKYVAYVLNSYGREAIVWFDGYDDPTKSTKVAEQCRRTNGQNVSSDILFELDMKVATSQQAFLGNRKKKLG